MAAHQQPESLALVGAEPLAQLRDGGSQGVGERVDVGGRPEGDVGLDRAGWAG